MRNKNHSKPAAVKRFEGDLAGIGCIHCFAAPQIHHVLGERARSSKLPVGLWFLNPLCKKHHDQLHNDRKSFEDEVFGRVAESRFELEKYFYRRSKIRFQSQAGPWPVPDDIYSEILEYHR